MNKDKLLENVKNQDKKTLLIVAVALIVIGILGKLLLIFGFMIALFVFAKIYQEKKSAEVKWKRKKRKKE